MSAPFAALEMTGPDRAEFLQRLLSNSVELAPGQGVHAYLLTVQGRPQLELWVYETGSAFWLVVPRSQAEHAFRDLDNYHFAEKLKLVDRTSEPCAVRLTGTTDLRYRQEGDLTICSFPYYGVPAELVWGSQETGVDPHELEALRVEAGSASPAEYTEKTMFLEVAGPDAYSETKGCYPGQEVVARTLHRGHVNRHLIAVKAAAQLSTGDRLFAGEREVGWVARGVVSPRQGPVGLAFVRREAIEGPWKREDGLDVLKLGG